MRVLVLSFYYPPDLSAGSFRASAIVGALREALPGSAEIDVITTVPNRYSSFLVQANKSEVDNNVTIYRLKIPRHKSGFFDQSRAFVAYAKQAKFITAQSEYDLVYATSSRLMTAVLGAWLAYKKQSKLYLDIRDIFVDTIGDVLSPKIAFIAKPVFSLIERWAFSRADKINLVSRGFTGYFKDRYPKANLSWFTNGIDEEFVAASPDEVECVEQRTPVIIFYAGNIGDGQGLHEIIPLLAKRLAGRAEFQIVGDGSRSEQLRNSIAEYGLKNVEIHPPVPRSELIEAYKQADILFLHLNNYPAFHKVLPSKLFEYAAMGKPILAGVAGYPAKFIAAEGKTQQNTFKGFRSRLLTSSRWPHCGGTN